MTMRRLMFGLVGIGMLGAASAGLSIVSAEELAGDVGWMSSQELVATFRGVTLEGKYSGGRKFVETYRATGRLSLVELEYSIPGRWSVTDNTFCTIYDHNSTGGCFRVAQVGSNCFEFYFVARTEQDVEDKKLKIPDWTARGSVRGREGEVCSDGVAV